MAITNPTAVQFCNKEVRVLADQLAKSYYLCHKIVNEWNALSISSTIPNSSETVDDGANRDGRPVITGAMVHNMINRASEKITDMELLGKAKLNTILQVAVNTD